MELEMVDKNFITKKDNLEDIKYINIKDYPILVRGVFYNEKLNRYERMDNEIANSISGHLSFLNGCTSGGRIRFKTNSDKISLKVILGQVWGLSCYSKKHSVSFSLYVNNRFYKLFSPDKSWNQQDNSSYESTISFEDNKMKNIDIYFPLYTFVKDVFIGVRNKSVIKKAKAYQYEKPVVFYGSSTTQGGCASRPGNSYDALLSQSLSFDYINLGFSGNCKAEKAMAEYISKLDMSVFVFDYDYNAETVEELKIYHESFYKIVRKAKPDLPIILLPKPNAEPNPIIWKQREEVIKKTYTNAIANGDNNIYYLDHKCLYNGFAPYAHTIDGCHPNDIGYYLIAKELKPLLKKLLKER